MGFVGFGTSSQSFLSMTSCQITEKSRKRAIIANRPHVFLRKSASRLEAPQIYVTKRDRRQHPAAAAVHLKALRALLRNCPVRFWNDSRAAACYEKKLAEFGKSCEDMLQ